MIPLAPIFRKAYWAVAFLITFYVLALSALTSPWLQRQYVSMTDDIVEASAYTVVPSTHIKLGNGGLISMSRNNLDLQVSAA